MKNGDDRIREIKYYEYNIILLLRKKKNQERIG